MKVATCAECKWPKARLPKNCTAPFLAGAALQPLDMKRVSEIFMVLRGILIVSKAAESD